MRRPTFALPALEQAAAKLAQLPVVEHVIEVAGRDWLVAAIADQSALTAVADDLPEFPFGLMLWDAAPVLATEVSRIAKQGQTVLELGAGVGLAGLVAVSLGATVMQTDHSAEALALCAENARRNGIDGVALAVGDWRDWPIHDQFEVILGSDLLYDSDLHVPLLDVLTRSLAPGGRVLLSDPGRSTAPAFLALLERNGWKIERRRKRVASLAPVRPGETVVVTIIETTRPQTTG